MEFGRLITAMVTPFDDEDRVDYAQAGRLANALLDSGSDGVLLAGTTGEAPVLTVQERLRLFREVKNSLGNRGCVMAGTGTYSTADSIDLSRRAEDEGVDILLLTVPYYNRPSQEGLVRHFRAIGEATNLPCVLYNIPSRTGTNMSADTALTLAEVPNIVGVKEASGDLGQMARIIDKAGDGFYLWSGDDGLTVPVLALGGYGVISVLSHLAGLQMQEMIKAFLAGQVGESSQVYRRLLPLIVALMTTATNPIPIKYVLNHIGFRVGRPRLPLVEPDQVVGERIMAEVRRHRIDLPVAA